MIPELEQLGFTRNEANVYAAALKLGKASVQQIAGTTGLNRITVHSIVEKFESMQIFLRTYEGKRRRVTPVDPERLRSLLEREQEELQGKLHAFEKIAPQLSDLFLRAQRGLEVYTLHGEEGLIFLCEDVLTCDEEILEYANIELLTKAIGPYLLKNYLPKKHKLQRRTKFLFVRTPGARLYIEQNYIRPPECGSHAGQVHRSHGFQYRRKSGDLRRQNRIVHSVQHAGGDHQRPGDERFAAPLLYVRAGASGGECF